VNVEKSTPRIDFLNEVRVSESTVGGKVFGIFIMLSVKKKFLVLLSLYLLIIKYYSKYFTVIFMWFLSQCSIQTVSATSSNHSNCKLLHKIGFG